MASFHAFADMASLGTQSSSNSFGAKTVNEFRLTSSFANASDVKAYAVVTGTVLIQNVNITDDPTQQLVNLIIKPFFQARIDFAPVKYFIYRGLKKSDFVAGGVVKTTGTEYIDNIQTVQTARNAAHGTTDLIPLESLYGHDLTPSGSTLIDEFFYDTSVDSELTPITTGTFLGNFKTGKCGFEIVLESPTYFPNFTMFQLLVNKVTSASGTTVQKRHLREKVLNYVDPAAYYGMHLEEGVGVGNKTGVATYVPATDDISGLTIYENIVKMFATRNTVYFDIRDTNGNSLNFYTNYIGQAPDLTKEIKLALTPGPAVKAEFYNKFNWPFHVLDDPGNILVEDNIYYFSLPLNENPSPLVFVERGNFNSSDKFITEEELLAIAANPAWTDDITFVIPNRLSVSTTEKQISTVAKIHYIRKINVDPVATSVVETKNYTDVIFGPVGLTPLWDTSKPTKWIAGFHKKYIDAETKGEELSFEITRDLISISGSTFTIVGNYSTDILPLENIAITDAGDPLNNATYSVNSATYISGNTVIIVGTAPNSDSGLGKLHFSKKASILGVNSIKKRVAIKSDGIELSDILLMSTASISGSSENIGTSVVLATTEVGSNIELTLSDSGLTQYLTTPRPGFGYMAETGVAIENQRIIYYATPFEYNPSVIGVDTPTPVKKKTLGGITTQDSFFVQLEGMIPELTLQLSTLINYQLPPLPTEVVTVLSFEGQSSQHAPFSRSNFLALGITLAEQTLLKNAYSSILSNYHPVFFSLIPTSSETLVSSNSINYKKYELKATGLNSAGIETSVGLASGSEIFVYSRDELLFTSHDFGELEDLSVYNPRVAKGMKFEEEQRLKTLALGAFTTDSAMALLVSNFEDDIEATNDPTVIASYVKSYGADVYAQALNYQIQNPTALEDRPLYWARLHMRVALRLHPVLSSAPVDLKNQIDELEEISRGFYIADFKPVIEITGSTGNDGIYKASAVNLISGDTVLTIDGNIVDPTVDGQIEYSHYVKITAVNIVTDEITVIGDFTSELSNGDNIAIAKTSQKNGHYTVNTAILVGSSTKIKVNENISNATVEGELVFTRTKSIGAVSTGASKVTINGVDLLAELASSTKRILVSGFDTYSLSSKPEQSNPAGIIGLTLHDKVVQDGVLNAHVQSAGIYPVSWRYFDEGFIEDGFRDYIKNSKCDAVFTYSQDGDYNSCQLDRFFARERSRTSTGNEGKKSPGFPTLPRAKYYYETSLPFIPMIYKHIGQNYTMRMDQSYTPNYPTKHYIEKADIIGGVNMDPSTITGWAPNPAAGVVKKGSGSDYMSNEIAYRVARLRENHNPTLATGHIHVVDSSFLQSDAHDLVSDMVFGIKNMLLYLK